MHTIKLKIQDTQFKPIFSFLKTLNYVEVEEELQPKVQKLNFEKGNFKKGEKPSDFAGIWQNEKRDLKEIRAKAYLLIQEYSLTISKKTK